MTYAVYFYVLITVGSLLSIAYSLRGGQYLSSLHAIGLLLVIFAVGFSVLRGDYLQTDVRSRASEDDPGEDGDHDTVGDLPFSAGFWEALYTRYIDRSGFRRVEMGMYAVGVLSLAIVQAAVKFGF
ncbi:hypothetical protein BN903_218 [Halorubrum sp. AJ67]|nr:hypothetical protein BN903_218 [Halorubrum sp. AJ67]